MGTGMSKLLTENSTSVSSLCKRLGGTWDTISIPLGFFFFLRILEFRFYFILLHERPMEMGLGLVLYFGFGFGFDSWVVMVVFSPRVVFL